MTDETQLRLQIQEEIDREVKIDRLIEAKVKKILKESRQFYRVGQRKGCDAILFFHRDDLSKTSFKVDDDTEPLPFNDRVTYFFIKNKNNHHSKSHTRSFNRDKVDVKIYH